MITTAPQSAARQPKAAGRFRNARVSRSELILFTTQLSVMLSSGVVVSDAIAAIAAQTKQGVFKEVLEDLCERISSGDDFSTCLSAYPLIFNTMFISMVRASEASGKMPQMLEILSGYLDAEQETARSIKGAMFYPAAMMVVSLLATMSLMVFVLPKFTIIYQARGVALPKMTQMLVDISDFFVKIKNSPTALTTIVVVFFILHYLAGTAAGKRLFDSVKISIPLIGTMFIESIMTRSMRIMATMLNTGVPMLDAMDVINDSCDNIHFRNLWTQVTEKIHDGYQLSDAINLANRKKLVAGPIIQMLKSGEKSGEIGRVCDKISDFYERKLKASIKSTTALIEPAMIVIMGLVIGTIAIALLMPVFKISSVVGH